MLLATDAGSAGATAWLVLGLCVLAALVVLFAAALVLVLRTPGLPPAGQAAWVLGVLVFPLVGPVAWFLVGRRSTPPAHRP